MSLPAFSHCPSALRSAFVLRAYRFSFDWLKSLWSEAAKTNMFHFAKKQIGMERTFNPKRRVEAGTLVKIPQAVS
jgi:hypothetical protein